jgi:hypothetical protein
MRFEKPHSLSYHDETLTSQPETLVRVASKLKLCGGLGLIDAAHAGEVANAYRMFRKLQHQIRPHGHQRARVQFSQVEKAAAQVKRL